MNSDFAFEIVRLALLLPRMVNSAKVQEGIDVADTLLKIVQTGAQAYRQQTGVPLDPALIRSEEPI